MGATLAHSRDVSSRALLPAIRACSRRRLGHEDADAHGPGKNRLLCYWQFHSAGLRGSPTAVNTPLWRVRWTLGLGTRAPSLAMSFSLPGLHIPGTHAQYIEVPARYLLKDDTGLKPEEVATLPVAFATAVPAVKEVGGVKAGDTGHGFFRKAMEGLPQELKTAELSKQTAHLYPMLSSTFG